MAELIRIYGKALKERSRELEKELGVKIEWFYDDDTPVPILADGTIYTIENDIRVE